MVSRTMRAVCLVFVLAGGTLYLSAIVLFNSPMLFFIALVVLVTTAAAWAASGLGKAPVPVSRQYNVSTHIPATTPRPAAVTDVVRTLVVDEPRIEETAEATPEPVSSLV